MGLRAHSKLFTPQASMRIKLSYKKKNRNMYCLDVFFVHNFLTGFLQIHIVVYSLWLCYTVILIFILGFTLFLCPLLSNFDSFVVLAKLTFEIDILNKMVSMYAKK